MYLTRALVVVVFLAWYSEQEGVVCKATVFPRRCGPWCQVRTMDDNRLDLSALLIPYLFYKKGYKSLFLFHAAGYMLGKFRE